MAEDNGNTTESTPSNSDKFAKLMLGTAAAFAATLLVEKAYDAVKNRDNQTTTVTES